ncbi:hypothetical protein [Desulfospira joergensenii]|uniref:hypothetical protein n=1 Tax=Desulfospira joergensenii TaxID=53329 RepID=UPI0003B5AFF3|nr:hypothetical protein [Desulfospira joergensenii]
MDKPKESSYVSMTAPQLVKALCDHSQVGSPRHSEITGALAAVLIKNLTDSIDRHERAATRERR